MKIKIRQQLANRKGQISRLLDKSKFGDCSQPVFTARNVSYEISDRVRGLAFGGIGAFYLLAQHIGFVAAINRRLPLLKVHLPYHESEHVLNIAINARCNGDCLQVINLLQDIFDDVRIGVWQKKPEALLDLGIFDVDGSQVEPTGQCKEGMDISTRAREAINPLLVSLANTREIMRLVNRPANPPSHEGAPDAIDRVLAYNPWQAVFR